MRPAIRRALLVLLWMAALTIVLVVVTKGMSFDVLHPAGEVARKQRNLIIFASALSLLVVLPVFILTAFIGIKYRATNKGADYRPEWNGSKKLELLWWCIPMALILVLSVVTWNSSHDLDPYKKLTSDKKPLKVQVIAYDWKWLFIYPEERIASLNALHIPVDRPIDFEITSNGTMNSFWIPKLGGQVYAMSGMTSQLHLMANETGTFKGRSANISGDGFADMEFDTFATSSDEYTEWVIHAQAGSTLLDESILDQLDEPSSDDKPQVYAFVAEDAYHTVVNKFMSYGIEAHHEEAGQ